MDRKKLCLVLAVIFALNIAMITLAESAAATSYKKGSTGGMVSKIQTTLKDQGFYFGDVDGVYGSATEAAVIKYQKRYGLTPDGKAGPATLDALGIAQSSTENARSGDLNLLARLISAEARGESYRGQVAVGAVVLNRVDSPIFPNTIAGVIYQNGAFSCLADGEFNKPVSESAYRAARDALNGVDPCGGALYYFNPAKTSNAWMWSRPLIVVIGNHRFCS